MKGIKLLIAILLTIGISLETSTATAEQRVKIFESEPDEADKPVISFELAESGIVIKFPLKPPETIASNQHR